MMFGSMGDMFKLLSNMNKIAKEYKKQMEELKEKTVEVSVAGEQVKVVVNGLGEVKSIKIAPELLQSGDVEIIEDLIVSAVNSGIERSRELAQEQIGQLASTLPLGDLKGLMEKFQGGNEES